MTYDEIVDYALARALDFGGQFPSTRPVYYRRIEIRQQQLFTMASRVNPDYFGVTAKGTLDANYKLNLADLDTATDLDPTAAITRVLVLGPGTHPTLQAGDEITIVPETDEDAFLPPRMTLRNFILAGVDDDLEGVATVCVHYGYRPQNNTAPMDGTETAELPQVFQELLVIDLSAYMVRQTLSMDAETKAAALQILQAEEKEMLDPFLAEVADYANAQASRFGDVKGSVRL